MLYRFRDDSGLLNIYLFNRLHYFYQHSLQVYTASDPVHSYTFSSLFSNMKISFDAMMRVFTHCFICCSGCVKTRNQAASVTTVNPGGGIVLFIQYGVYGQGKRIKNFIEQLNRPAKAHG